MGGPAVEAVEIDPDGVDSDSGHHTVDPDVFTMRNGYAKSDAGRAQLFTLYNGPLNTGFV